MNKSRLPRSLKEARDRARLTQAALASKANVTVGAVSQWETGATVPSGPSRLALSLIFAVPLQVIDGWFSATPAAVAS